MRCFAWVCVAIGLLPAVTGAQEETEKEGLPLEPARQIEFTTDEVTWLSLDVAPDGERLVLEILGDLYTLPMAGGEATPLTSGLGFDSQPKFSPDGRHVAFISDRDGAENLWILRSDGTEPKKLSDERDAELASPAWSPDSSYVYVSQTSWGQSAYEIWMYHVEGGGGVQVTKAKPEPKTPRNQRLNALGPVASSDGRYLYYAQKTGGFQYNATFPMWQVVRRDLVSGDEDVLTQDQGSAVRPVLSPDGRKLIYGTRFDTETGLRIRDLGTGEDRWLFYPVQRDDQESRFTRDLLPGYAFTPDGAAIVVTYGGKIHRVAIATGEAAEIPFSAAVSQGLGPLDYFPHRVEDGPVRARLIQDATPSPSGDRLAFSSLTRLYVMDLPSGTPRALGTNDLPAFQPAWSPDGSTLVYVSWTGVEGHVYKVAAQGGPPERLTRVPAFYSDPAWSPDGRRIVVLRGSAYERFSEPYDGPPPGMDLVWLPSEGGDAALILPARGLGKPHFTDDPERVYLYLSGGLFSPGAGHGLVSVRFDGTDRREHLKVVGPGVYFAEEPVGADDARMSPDGKWALAHVSNQLYLMAVPRVGGEAPTVDITKPTVPLEKLTDVGADYFGWDEDGRTIYWSIGSSFFRRPAAEIRFAPPEDEASGEEGAEAEAYVAPESEPGVTRVDVTIEAPRVVPEGTVVLRGARIVTMRGDEVIERGDVVVRGNRIVSVGASSLVAPDARVIDVSGATIVPGFVDTHAHWSEIRRGVLDVANYSFFANLAYGVTAGLDVQTSTNDMLAYQDLVDAGILPGPRAYSTGPGIFSDNRFETLDQVRSVLRRYKEHYRTHNVKSYVVGNRKQRQLMVQAAHELQIMPTTEGALDLKLDLTHVLDGFSGNEHSFPIVPLYDDVVELVARSRTSYTPTLLVAYGGPWAENYYYTTTEVHDDPKLRRFLPHNLIDADTQRRPWFREEEHVFRKTAAQAAKILRAGGRVGVGSHGQLQGLGYHWELWSIASGGLTPLEALRVATLGGADILGLAQDLGSLEPGKLADLVVLNENPLEDIHNTNTVRYVMKNGELFEGDTLDRIWPSEKTLAPLWWWDRDPVPGQPGQ